MKSRILAASIATLAGLLPVSATPPPSLVPNAEQQRMIDRSYGMFIHFGINTYSGQEWTDGTLDPKIYNPTKLDTDQWAKTAKDAGMTYVILTVKHIDGFCLWDSEHTEYDVASSPVKTDIIKSMAKSCKKYGIELGIYYALWDRKWGGGVMRGHKANLTEEQSRDYADYMKAQLTEVLSNYGDVCELWLDGGWVLPREQWHIDEIYAHVKSLQPECPVGVNWTVGQFGEPDAQLITPDKYRLGQPMRYASDFRLGDPYLPVFPDVKHYAGEDGMLRYLPFEATVTINKFWFWHPHDDGLLTVEQLLPLYECTTAQDNILILNSPPNREGLMDQRNVKRFKELATALGAKPGKRVPRNLADKAQAYATSTWSRDPGDWSARAAIDGNGETRWASEDETPTLYLQWKEPQTVNFLRIREYLNRIQKFEISAYVDGQWKSLTTGTSIGKNKVISIPKTTSTAIRLEIKESNGGPSLHFLATGLR